MGRKALSIAILLLLVLPAVPTSYGQSSAGSTGLTPTEANALKLNAVLFESTVPNVVNLGDNFSVSIQLRNVSNESIPAVVELATPVEALYVTPHVHKDSIKPGETVTEIFWVVPIQTFDNAQNVTLKVWVWFEDRMTTPALVIQDTTMVFSCGPSPLAPYVVAAVALSAVAAAAAVFLLVRRAARRRKGAEPPG